jgi:hypothetical protein
MSNHFFLNESSAFFIGSTYVILTGLTPQYSKVDFLNPLTLGITIVIYSPNNLLQTEPNL